MTQPNPFNLIMISSEMEHGGNTTQRRFDAHPNCFTYPMESQLGTKFSRNILIPSIHPVRYGYSEFPEGTTYERAFTLLWDEEVKCYANHRDRSKFRACGMDIDWAKRRERFLWYCTNAYPPNPESHLRIKAPFSRARVVQAYFHSLFDTWTNLNRSGKETHYVGYNPGMVADTDKLFADFPNAHVIHVVRNPWSAYGDYLKRPFGQQSIEEYCLAYNVAHTLAYNYAAKYPGHFHLVRLEDIMADTRAALEPILDKIGLPWDDALLYPSFNGKDLSAKIAPWGTLDQCTTEYNRAMSASLNEADRKAIAAEAALIIKTFGYEDYAK